MPGSWSYGIVDGPYGAQIITDALSAMYIRAQQADDTRLMQLLEHRAEAHNGGPCRCASGELPHAPAVWV